MTSSPPKEWKGKPNNFSDQQLRLMLTRDISLIIISIM